MHRTNTIFDIVIACKELYWQTPRGFGKRPDFFRFVSGPLPLSVLFTHSYCSWTTINCLLNIVLLPGRIHWNVLFQSHHYKSPYKATLLFSIFRKLGWWSGSGKFSEVCFYILNWLGIWRTMWHLNPEGLFENLDGLNRTYRWVI